ncbi:TPA: hypothetical protein ACPWLC_001839 [Pseudomonas aeruginosa]
MTNANECTCPSGDGSLRHPCPAHPAVEQAGGDDRVVGWRERILAAHPNSDPGFWPDALLVEHMAAEIADLRAALAQPSTKCATCNGSGFVEFERGAVIKDCPRCHRVAQPSPVSEALIYACKNLAQITSYDGSGHADIAMAVLRMAGVGDDERERLVNEWKAARAWKPSPAQAEQAEAERPEGPTEDELEAAGLGYPLHKEEAVKLWYSGFRSEVITVLEAWEAIGHDTGINPDKEELLDSLRYMLEKCEAHDAALARAAELEKELAMTRDAASKGDAARHAAGGMEMEIQELKAKLAEQAQHSAPEVFGLERYRVERTGQGFWPYCVRAGDGTRELFVGHLKQCKRVAAQLATAFEDGKFIARLPTVQAQHSVPEISGIGRDAEHPRAVVLYLRNEPSDEDMRAIQNFLRAISADVLTQAQHSVPELLEWAVGRWHAEVSLRPLINVHRRALDDTWRQVIRRLGGDTGLLCGPSHDELLAAAPGKEGL